jgi:hypothetical protein
MARTANRAETLYAQLYFDIIFHRIFKNPIQVFQVGFILFAVFCFHFMTRKIQPGARIVAPVFLKFPEIRSHNLHHFGPTQVGADWDIRFAIGQLKIERVLTTDLNK